MRDNLDCFFLPSADFFQNQLFRKISGIPPECQTVCCGECQTTCIQIRPNASNLNCLHLSYQQMTHVSRAKVLPLLKGQKELASL